MEYFSHSSSVEDYESEGRKDLGTIVVYCRLQRQKKIPEYELKFEHH